MSSLRNLKEVKGAPVMQFDNRKHNFGKLKKGDKVSHDFAFTNMGDMPLEVDSFSACDCTSVVWPSKPVLPGDKGVIKVTFDSKDKEDNDPVGVDLFLKQTYPGSDIPIIESLEYTFELIP